MRLMNNKHETINCKQETLKSLKFKVSSSKLRHGQILMFALILFVVVMIISTSLFSRVIMFLQSVSRAVSYEQASNLADAGADYAVWKLNQSPSVNPNGNTVTVGAGQFQIGTADVGSNKKITSTAYIPSWADCKIKRVVKVEVAPNTPSVLVLGQGDESTCAVLSSGA